MKHLYKILFFSVFLFIFGCEKKEYVKDFKVEGIAVGDSLLTYFTKEDILKNTRYKTISGEAIDPDEKYLDAQFTNYQFETYQGLQVYYERDDDKFIIQGIGGGIFYGNDAKKCNNKFNEVKLILKEQFTTPNISEDNNKKETREGYGDTTYTSLYLDFENGESIELTCTDFDNDLLEVQDVFQLNIFSTEMNEYWFG